VRWHAPLRVEVTGLNRLGPCVTQVIGQPCQSSSGMSIQIEYQSVEPSKKCIELPRLCSLGSVSDSDHARVTARPEPANGEL